MGYYRLLGLKREPFSTSPDPSLFYESSIHKKALYRLAVALRLKRGLSLVVGDVGSGKTTLCRRLPQLFEESREMRFHLALHSAFDSDLEFLQFLLESFHIRFGWGGPPSVFRCLQRLETELFRQAFQRGRVVVLLIDEAQKLSDGCLELLRVLLNFETNDSKLLQLVLFGQPELLPRLQGIRNLWDRVSLKEFLHPLDEEQTKQMIHFRLQTAGYRRGVPLFTDEAIHEIHRLTQGSPRRITLLAHDALEVLVMLDRQQVDHEVILRLVQRHPPLRAEAATPLAAVEPLSDSVGVP